MSSRIGVVWVCGLVVFAAFACSSARMPADDASGGVTGRAMSTATAGHGGVSATSGVAGASGGAGAIGVAGQTGTAGITGSGGSGGRSGAAGMPASGAQGPTSNGDAPAGFWDTSPLPQAKNVMIFRFLNRTNGTYADAEVYWSFKSGSISELHSIADQDTYDMPANSSGRLYFYLCARSDATCASDPTKSKYYDFIEHTIGAHQYNGNTTRVDAFGIKIAMRLHCADGFDRAVGEDYGTFQEDRATTFQKFIEAVPMEWKPLAQAPFAPYRIVEPGRGGFDKGGPYEHYYDALIDQIWSANGITIAKAGANGSGLGSYPDLSAAIYRHVGTGAGSFGADGKLANKNLWADSTTFYGAAPANYYAKFWHDHALGGKAYGFPYDDVGGYSSYVSHQNPEYLLVAVGW